MLKIAAQQYIIIGECLQDINLFLKDIGTADEPLIGGKLDFLKKFLLRLKKECDALRLTVSSPVLADYINRLSPLSAVNAYEERGRISTLMTVIIKEPKSELFLYVLPHRAAYYQWDGTFNEQLTVAFPRASRDLVHAGNCFAIEEYTACVYHSIRALEFGLRAFASYLKVSLSYPLELAEWGKLIGELEGKVEEMQQLPKTMVREEELSFCSHCLALFRHFKNAYRNPTAHARKYYEEDEAKSIMERTKETLESLATKLSE